MARVVMAEQLARDVFTSLQVKKNTNELRHV